MSMIYISGILKTIFTRCNGSLEGGSTVHGLLVLK